MKEDVERLIYRVIDGENATRAVPIDCTRRAETPLYGENGQLDSLSLVTLVIALEQEIEVELGLSVALASDRAVSSRRSPFASIRSLTDHIVQLAGKGSVRG